MSGLASLAPLLAPHGVLRVSLNLGNALVGQSRLVDERPAGIAVDLARQLAQEVGLELLFVECESAATSSQILGDDLADLGFLAIDPARSQLTFSQAYLEIEGAFAVPLSSPIKNNADVDQPGHRVAAATGSAYSLYLDRALVNAKLALVPASASVIDAMTDGGLEAAAGIRTVLLNETNRRQRLRVLDVAFMVIQQAVAVPRLRPTSVSLALRAFVDRMIRCGFVAEAISRHGIEGAAVPSELRSDATRP